MPKSKINRRNTMTSARYTKKGPGRHHLKLSKAQIYEKRVALVRQFERLSNLKEGSADHILLN